MAYTYIVHTIAHRADLLLLTLEPASEADRLYFTAGQYASLGFIRRGRRTPVRCFSIVSSPQEPMLQFAMRITGRFTRAAARLRPGDTVIVAGPFGDFVIDSEQDRQIVLLAGGIGITPFISMLRDAAERQSNTPMTLLFANRQAQTIPFSEELSLLSRQNPALRVAFFAGRNDRSRQQPQTPITGNAITDEYIDRLTSGAYRGSTYFICGPAGFMRKLQKRLRHNGVHETRILTESFTQAKPTFVLGTKMSARSLTYSLAVTALIAMTGVIMVLDVSRNVSKIRPTVSAQTVVQQAGSSRATSSTVSTGSTSVPAQTQYQAPVSSVS